MARPLVTVPPALLRMGQVDWDIDWRSQSPGERTDGVSQVVVNGFPRWIGSPDIVLRRGLVGAWRALRWQGQGQVGIWRVPMFDPGVMNLAALAQTGSWPQTGVPFSAGESFSSGQGFAFLPYGFASADAAAGASAIRITVASAALAPVPGQIMSHDDWPFGVTAVSDLGDLEYEIYVQRMRSAITAGDQVSLVGVGRFELVSDDTGRPSYGPERWAQVGVQWREVLVR